MNRRLLRSGGYVRMPEGPPPTVLLKGHTAGLAGAELSPDGSKVVTASSVWDAANGSVLVSLKGYEEAVRNAGFSPDGERILTATFDGVARIWDVSSYQPR